MWASGVRTGTSGGDTHMLHPYQALNSVPLCLLATGGPCLTLGLGLSVSQRGSDVLRPGLCMLEAGMGWRGRWSLRARSGLGSSPACSPSW